MAKALRLWHLKVRVRSRWQRVWDLGQGSDLHRSSGFRVSVSPFRVQRLRHSVRRVCWGLEAQGLTNGRPGLHTKLRHAAKKEVENLWIRASSLRYSWAGPRGLRVRLFKREPLMCAQTGPRQTIIQPRRDISDAIPTRKIDRPTSCSHSQVSC